MQELAWKTIDELINGETKTMVLKVLHVFKSLKSLVQNTCVAYSLVICNALPMFSVIQ